MKKINGFYFSVVLLTLSAMTHTALAADHKTAPGSMCSAFNGNQQGQIRTRTGARSNQLYVATVPFSRNKVTVKCPIIMDDMTGNKPFTVKVHLFHSTDRSTSCRLIMANRRTLRNSSNNSIILTETTSGISNRVVQFRVNNRRAFQNVMFRCDLLPGSQGSGDAGGTRLVSYEWIED